MIQTTYLNEIHLIIAQNIIDHIIVDVRVKFTSSNLCIPILNLKFRKDTKNWKYELLFANY